MEGFSLSFVVFLFIYYQMSGMKIEGEIYRRVANEATYEYSCCARHLYNRR